MKTVVIEEVDGFKIVRSLSRLLIDRVASVAKASKATKDTDEFLDIISLKDKLSKTAAGKEKNKLKSKLIIAGDKLREKIKVLRAECIEYFEVKGNETIISQEEYDSYLSLLKECSDNGDLLTIDKVKMKDLRGHTYYLKVSEIVTKHTIEKLGESYPNGAILEPTEQELADSMDTNLKLSVYKSKKSLIAEKISLKCIELELDGMPADDAKSQVLQEYQEEYNQLKTLYKQ